MKSDKRGFTLIELLVVIGILGVLAAFLFPAIRSARLRGKITQTKTNIMSLTTAIKQYHSDFFEYPCDLDDQNGSDNDVVMRLLTGRNMDGSNDKDTTISANKKWGGPYLEMNYRSDFKSGDDLMDNSDGFEDGYSSTTGRAAYIDGWKNGTKYTYFIFKFPNDRNGDHLPLFNEESFDIYSAGPDGMGKYTTLSGSYDYDDYKGHAYDGDEVNEDNIVNAED